MKGGGVIVATAAKRRRWRGPMVVAVLGLVLLSMLVPLFFLHNAFHSPLPLPGYNTSSQLHQSSTSNGFRFYDRQVRGNTMNNPSEGDRAKHVDGLIRQLAPTRPKDFQRNSSMEAMNKTKGSYVPTAVSKPHPIANNTRAGAAGRASEHKQVIDETEKICELKYGSYCLWRQENREYMKDSIVKKMKDQLYVARAYYPSVAKLPALDKLSNELKQNIQEYERVLSESSSDTDLPPQIEKKLQKMEATITKAKALPLDCNNIDKKLGQLVDLTADEANFHMKQSAFLYQLAVQTTPKSLHCLSMRLTVEYFRSSFPLDMEQSQTDRYLNPELHHYIIFSNNVLAASVVINSTVMHARASANQVFHVLTDKQSFFAMKMWFFKNSYKEAAVQVLEIEEFVSHDHDKTYIFHPLLPEEFRVFFPGTDNQSTSHIRTEYLSVFSHSQYALPKIFQTLKKVVVLDEDVVVQRDLSGLWSIELNGKVNGAVQTCTVRLSELKHFLGENNGLNSCAWMSGVNVVDLVRWRELDVTRTFKRLVNEATKEDGISEEAVILRASLLTFRGLVHVLDDTWMLSGLGHNYGLDDESIKKSAVVHFNGNMKPWLELGVTNYKGYWTKYLNRENQFISDCNVNS